LILYKFFETCSSASYTRSLRILGGASVDWRNIVWLYPIANHLCDAIVCAC